MFPGTRSLHYAAPRLSSFSPDYNTLNWPVTSECLVVQNNILPTCMIVSLLEVHYFLLSTATDWNKSPLDPGTLLLSIKRFPEVRRCHYAVPELLCTNFLFFFPEVRLFTQNYVVVFKCLYDTKLLLKFESAAEIPKQCFFFFPLNTFNGIFKL